VTGPILHLDFETFSECDLRRSGAYAYAMHPSTDILCAAWRFDDEPVRLWKPGQPQPCGDEPWPDDVRIVAHNAAFERLIWKHVATLRYGWPAPPDDAFWCTAAEAANLGLPRDLEGAGIALGATVQKDPTGRRVMLKLSQPRRVTKADARTRWTPEMAPEDFDHLYRYCVQDVEAECAIGGMMRPISERERALYLLDQKINDRGVKIDRALIAAALAVVEAEQTRLNREIAQATGGAVTACTQAARIVDWLKANDLEVDSVAGHVLKDMLATDIPGDTARAVLLLRQEAAKSSTAKLKAMLNAACPDDRIRGSLLYYGAARTGRWSGRLHQPQNYPRGDEAITAHADEAVAMILAGATDAMRLGFGSPLDVVSSCLRPCMVAEDGHDLMCPDFSNVEGRGLAWLAGEEWKLQAFRDFDAGTGPDLYKVTYGRSVGVPVDQVDKAGRQRGKVIELACGYQGWVGAFQTFAKLYGLKMPDEEAAQLAGAWRDAHPRTKAFWFALNDAALAAVANPGRKYSAGAITYLRQDGWLWCRLPSGRVLAYANPSIARNDRGEDAVHYWGVPNPAKPIPQDGVSTRRWARLSAYGGLLAENVTQAMCRDLLAEAMLRLDAAGYPVVLTCHDEIIIEAAHNFGSPAEVRQIVSEVPAWATGFPIAVGSIHRARRYSK
jgi:DNA polymerase